MDSMHKVGRALGPSKAERSGYQRRVRQRNQSGWGTRTCAQRCIWDGGPALHACTPCSVPGGGCYEGGAYGGHGGALQALGAMESALESREAKLLDTWRQLNAQLASMRADVVGSATLPMDLHKALAVGREGGREGGRGGTCMQVSCSPITLATFMRAL